MAASSTCCCSIVPLEFDIFIGLDVDKKSISATVLNHKQKLCSLKMPNIGEMMINYTKKHFPGKRVAFAYEVGPTGYGLYDKLTAAEYTCLVVSPSSVPTPSDARVKTNRLDSGRLAITLRGGELKGVRVPSAKYRNLRHLIQLYNTVSRQSAACKCRIKSLLLVEGIAYPSTSKNDHWSNYTIRRLETLSCEPSIRFKLDMLLEILRFHRQQLLRVKKELRRFCKDDPDLADSVRYLISIPGIGWTISVHLLARIGDWRNLKNVRELAGFIGLTPCEKSTGDDVNKGNITRSGDSRLRNMLIEGAWAAVIKDPELREFFKRIYARHPRDRAARKAIVAVARKMTTRIYSVLKNRRLYIPQYEEYNLSNKTSNKKRRLRAPEDASTLRRTRKYVLKRDKFSPVLTDSFMR